MSNVETSLEIRVDAGKCLAYGNCVSVAPDMFDLPAKAKTVIVLKRAVAEDELEELEEAVRSCPVRALSIGPAETGK
ncbi:ferredoxin [Janthinobacterium sp. HLX7-2]|uniref:ferredoxin n=1 Tax=Janthinobacterium sp. HLX7-2 TaxID=1259331 RepID=UPI003F238358